MKKFQPLRLVSFVSIAIMVLLMVNCGNSEQELIVSSSDSPSDTAQPVPWTGPSSHQIPVYARENGKDIYYGYELIARTSYFLGPKGKVRQISNGMNCQNCHLDAGTKPFGNNYGAVASTYPKFRERSGTVETIVKRVNDCFERSLNGKALDSSSREMQAIVAYIHWLGEKIPKGEKPHGSGIMELAYPNKAADLQSGRTVFINKCVSCHGQDGQGLPKADGSGYDYPPLWGPHSYNIGAGLFRLSRFAGYVYNNMPNTVNWHHPDLSEEQAWNVAAFVNSQPRPGKDLSKDWPKVTGKPVDHPFGPYADTFPEIQHKYGPYGPIAAWKKENAKKK